MNQSEHEVNARRRFVRKIGTDFGLHLLTGWKYTLAMIDNNTLLNELQAEVDILFLSKIIRDVHVF